MFYIDSPCVYSLLNYFPNNAATIKKLLYALVWTGILVLHELYTVKMRYYIMVKWNPWYFCSVW